MSELPRSDGKATAKKPYEGSYEPTRPAGIWKGTHFRTGAVRFFYFFHEGGRSQPFLTAREAAAHRDALLVRRTAPAPEPTAPMTFGQFMDERFLPAKQVGNASTMKLRQSCADRIRKLRPQLLDLWLSEVNLVELDLLAAAHGRDYEPSTVAQTIKFVGRVMRYAVADGRIPKFEVKWTPGDFEEVHPPTPMQVRAMLDKLAHSKATRFYAAPVTLVVLTGLRNAELRGLKLDNLPAIQRDMRTQRWTLDPDAPQRVYIDAHMDDFKPGYRKKTKTRHGRRWVPLSEAGHQMLVDHLNEHGHGPVVTEEDGRTPATLLFGSRGLGQSSPWITPHALLNAINAAAKRAGFETTVHQLRHFYATQCARANVPPKELQRRMGHADFRITMNLYAGFYPEDNDHDPAGRLLDQFAPRTSARTSASSHQRVASAPNGTLGG